jgi:negative regulator of flagellin synthesis FlgM
MIIDGTNNPFAINKFDPNKTSGATTSKGSVAIKGEDTTEKDAATGDKVVISDRSRLIAKATELSLLAPDIRSEKVADLTARIAAGTYKVSSEDVASSIIKKGFSEII